MLVSRRVVFDRLAVWSIAALVLGSAGASAVRAQSHASTPWPGIGFWRGAPLPTLPEPRPERMEAAEMWVPVPPRRPREFGSIEKRPLENESAAGEDCLARLRATGAVFTSVESPKTTNSACSIETPIKLASLSAPGGGSSPVGLPDRPIVACRLALAFDAWTKAVAPGLAASRGAPLVTMTTGPGWECRTRNRQPGAPLSNHANGLALDVNTFVFANKAHLSVAANGHEAAFQAVRATACSFFSTVLGPGSDGFHESHLHVDVLARRPGRFAKFCH